MTRVLLLWAGIGLLTGSPLLAHLGDRLLVIPELPTAELPDVTDGDLQDWNSTPVAFDHTDMLVNGVSQTRVDPIDTSARVFLAWNHASQRLYAGIEIIDDIANDFDGLAFMIDGDHSGAPYNYNPSSADQLEQMTQAQYYQFNPTRPPGGRFFRNIGFVSWAYTPEWIDPSFSVQGQAPITTTVEFSVVPWNLLLQEQEQSQPAKLHEGQIIGLQLVIFEADQSLEGQRSLGAAWAGDLNFTNHTQMFADALLLSCQHLDCSAAATAVQPQSWARIKVSF